MRRSWLNPPLPQVGPLGAILTQLSAGGGARKVNVAVVMEEIDRMTARYEFRVGAQQGGAGRGPGPEAGAPRDWAGPSGASDCDEPPSLLSVGWGCRRDGA